MKKRKTYNRTADPAKAKPGSHGQEPTVKSLARTLWDGMYDQFRKIEDDIDATTDYIRAMFPGVSNIRQLDDCVYFDYDGGKYFVRPEYSIGAAGKVYYGKLTVHDYDGRLEPVCIDRDTRNVQRTLEKFFKKANPAGNSPAAPAEPSLMDRLARLDAAVKTVNDELREIRRILKENNRKP